MRSLMPPYVEVESPLEIHETVRNMYGDVSCQRPKGNKRQNFQPERLEFQQIISVNTMNNVNKKRQW